MKIKKVMRRTRKRMACAFLLLPLLACNYTEAKNNEVNKDKRGAIMPVLKQKNALDEYKHAEDKRAYVVPFVKSNSFARCKSFMDSVLADSSLSLDDKQLAVATVYRRYHDEVRNYALDKIKAKVFTQSSSLKLKKNDNDTVVIMSEMLATSEAHLNKYAKYVSAIGPSALKMLKSNAVQPILAAHFANALIFRAELTNKEDALRIAKEIMQDTSAYSVFVNAYAANALIKIDASRGAKMVNEERMKTLNPIKSSALEGVLDGYNDLIPKINH